MSDSLVASPARVCKYVLPLPNREGHTRVEMPGNARVLSVGVQDDYRIVVWALETGDPAEWPSNPRDFIVVNTGMWIEESRLAGARFIGTVTCAGIVWHIWEDEPLA